MDNTESDPKYEPVDAMVAQGLPKHTTPTWEVELLISGIAVFAMLQLPGWLDDRYFDLFPRVDLNWRTILSLSYVYAKCGALILAVTFVLHLLMRAQWIALVGLDSIYPTGVRWERTRLGRQQIDVERTLMGSIADATERADNRATIVFAVGVYMTMQMIKLLLFVLLCSLLALGLSLVMPIEAGPFVLTTIALVMLPMAFAWKFDRTFGERLRPDGLPARTLRAVFRVLHAIGLGRGSMPGMLLIGSHAGSRRVFAIVFVILMSTIAFVLLGVEFSRDADRFGNFAFVSQTLRGGDRTLLRQHYDDQRGERRFGVAPYVQSQVITDTYLRLTIPIQPALHETAMRQRCPEVIASPIAKTTSAQLDCFAALHPLQLDGHPLKVSYDLGSDPKAQRPALIAMIDLRTLANGRHELLVGEPSQPDGSATSSDRIPFWR